MAANISLWEGVVIEFIGIFGVSCCIFFYAITLDKILPMKVVVRIQYEYIFLLILATFVYSSLLAAWCYYIFRVLTWVDLHD